MTGDGKAQEKVAATASDGSGRSRIWLQRRQQERQKDGLRDDRAEDLVEMAGEAECW
jgi:hypothetical protein